MQLSEDEILLIQAYRKHKEKEYKIIWKTIDSNHPILATNSKTFMEFINNMVEEYKDKMHCSLEEAQEKIYAHCPNVRRINKKLQEIDETGELSIDELSDVQTFNKDYSTILKYRLPEYKEIDKEKDIYIELLEMKKQIITLESENAYLNALVNQLKKQVPLESILMATENTAKELFYNKTMADYLKQYNTSIDKHIQLKDSKKEIEKYGEH